MSLTMYRGCVPPAWVALDNYLTKVSKVDFMILKSSSISLSLFAEEKIKLFLKIFVGL